MCDIHIAAEEGNINKIQSIISDDPDLVNFASSIGDFPLHDAVAQRQLEAATLLLRLGADVNAKGNRGRTPLHCAAVAKSVELAEMLLDAGAEIEVADERGQTPLVTAVYHVEIGIPESQEVVDLLLHRGAVYGIEAAVAQEDQGGTKEIFEINPQALQETSERLGVKLIHGAIHHAGIMRLLLEHGGDPNAHEADTVFSSPPITKVESPEVAAILLSHGADPNVRNSEGMTRLQMARKYSQVEMIEVLQRYGAQPRRSG